MIVGKLCGGRQAMWPWISCIPLVSCTPLASCVTVASCAAVGKLCSRGVFGCSLASDPGVDADAIVAHRKGMTIYALRLPLHHNWLRGKPMSLPRQARRKSLPKSSDRPKKSLVRPYNLSRNGCRLWPVRARPPKLSWCAKVRGTPLSSTGLWL
jgi:hypothetical protein